MQRPLFVAQRVKASLRRCTPLSGPNYRPAFSSNRMSQMSASLMDQRDGSDRLHSTRVSTVRRSRPGANGGLAIVIRNLLLLISTLYLRGSPVISLGFL